MHTHHTPIPKSVACTPLASAQGAKHADGRAYNGSIDAIYRRQVGEQGVRQALRNDLQFSQRRTQRYRQVIIKYTAQLQPGQQAGVP